VNTYLAFNAGLFFIGCTSNLWDLGRERTARMTSRGVIAATALLQGVLCAWALFLLVGRWGM
jgi:hypothetical protein